MSLLNRYNKNTGNCVLSATRPSVSKLIVNATVSKPLKTMLKQRMVIKIYVDESKNKKYVEHSTAYALGLIKTRAVMLEKPHLVEITDAIFNKLESDSRYRIDKIIIENKQPLKVYVDGDNYFIDISAAYALNLLGIEDFQKAEDKYYYITKELLEKLSSQYNIEKYAMGLEQTMQDRNNSK